MWGLTGEVCRHGGLERVTDAMQVWRSRSRWPKIDVSRSNADNETHICKCLLVMYERCVLGSGEYLRAT